MINVDKLYRYLVWLAVRIPFVSIWIFVFAFASFMDSQGWLSVYKDAFGMPLVIIGVALACLISTSVFWLYPILKKEGKTHALSYTVTVLFLIMAVLLSNVGDRKFCEFSEEKWEQYPQRRITMCEDLAKRKLLEDKTLHEVEEVLGVADRRNTDVLVYDDGRGNCVFVEFKDGVFFDVYSVD